MNRAPAAILQHPIPDHVDTNIHQPRDPNTLSNYNVWKINHITANLEMDFSAQKVFGSINYDMHRLSKGVKEIVLDTRSVFYSSPILLTFLTE